MQMMFKGNLELSAQIRALRKELNDAVPPGHHRMPDGSIMKDSDHTEPTPTPPTDDPPPIPDELTGDTEAPSTIPPPDTDVADPSPFTGAPGTGFSGVASTQPRPKFNQRVYAYVDSLPRGEQNKAMNALRNYVYGPGRMHPDAAIEKYKERRVRDAQAPVGSTDFDDLAATDSDAEESDDDVISLQPRYRRGPMAGFFSSDTLPSRTDNTQAAPALGSRIDDYFDNLGGAGRLNGGAHDAERLALHNAKATLGHRRRILTRFDEDEDNTWLDPDRSGPPDSAMNELYDIRDDVTEAEQALKTARLEHAALGYENALDGSQVAQMLVGSGLTIY